jgi:hypothetical protein
VLLQALVVGLLLHELPFSVCILLQFPVKLTSIGRQHPVRGCQLK